MIFVISRIGGLSEAGFTGFVGFSGLASGVGNRSSLLQKITYFFIEKTTKIRGFRPSRK